MRARLLANASISTAPIFTGAGAALSFMVIPPLPSPSGPNGPCFGHISELPEFQINILNLRQFHACCPILAEGRVGAQRLGRMGRWGFAWRREGASRRFAMARRWRLLVPIIAAVGLAGCSSISEKFRDTAAALPGVGLPADAPERTGRPVAFPAVHDVPPPRNSV